jgi:hypothetical protein
VYIAVVLIKANGQTKGSRKNVSASEGLDLEPYRSIKGLRSRLGLEKFLEGLVSGRKPNVSVSSRSRAPIKVSFTFLVCTQSVQRADK